jgi:hypothetical protein
MHGNNSRRFGFNGPQQSHNLALSPFLARNVKAHNSSNDRPAFSIGKV